MKSVITRALSLCGAAGLLMAMPCVVTAEFGGAENAATLANEIQAQAQADNPGISPEFFQGNNFEFYPMLLNNVEGFDSLIAISNLLDTAGRIQLCVVPSGSTQLQCTGGIPLPPRATLFYSAGFGPLALLQNTTGQVFVFAEANTFGASVAFILDQNGQGITAMYPYLF